jgi:hypothetical protein
LKEERDSAMSTLDREKSFSCKDKSKCENPRGVYLEGTRKSVEPSIGRKGERNIESWTTSGHCGLILPLRHNKDLSFILRVTESHWKV